MNPVPRWTRGALHNKDMHCVRRGFLEKDDDGNGAKHTEYFLHSCEQMASPSNNGVFLTKRPRFH